MAQETEPKLSAAFPNGMKIDDRYEIIDMLGAGGFATVYKARHLMIDRDVALKVMDLQKGVVDNTYAERFFREAKIAAKIQHPNVVTIYDFGFVGETQQPYIAMELLEGYDLDHELSKVGPLSPNRAYALFRPVLEALGEGHRLGIVHKDLKPANLYMIDPGGVREQMKVLDFGVARLDSGQVAKLTDAGQLMGTPRYLAPEYIKSQIVTPAIDVYQMALIISEALTGIPAVDGNAYTAMMLHCSGNLQISDFLREGPVGEVFSKALCIDHTQRYQNCQEFAEALDSVACYFDSNVPLQGGAPQRSPDLHLTLSTVNSIVGSSDLMQTGRHPQMAMGEMAGSNAAEKKRKSVLPFVAIAAIALIGFFGLIIIMAEDEEEPKPTEPIEPQVVYVDKTSDSVTFAFSSDPSGAQIRKFGTDEIICEKTPCVHVFKGPWPMDVDFVLDNYYTKSITLTADLDSNVSVALDPFKRRFNFNSNPAGATVKTVKGEILCKATPCNEQFSGPWPMEVEIAMNGYTTEKITLTTDKDSNIDILLKKRLQKEETQVAATTTTTKTPKIKPPPTQVQHNDGSLVAAPVQPPKPQPKKIDIVIVE